MKPISLVKHIMLCIAVFGFVVGCSEKSKEPTVSMFEVKVDELTIIKVDQPFILLGVLKNTSKHTWDITHGAGMFTYFIFDEDGNQLTFDHEVLFRNDIGYVSGIEAGGQYRNNGEEHRSKEFYQFIIRNPGKYQVKTIAEFQVSYDEASYRFEIESDLYDFLVEE